MSEVGVTETLHSAGRESSDGKQPEVDYRFATKADLEEFYGRQWDGTIRALVWTVDGKVEGVIGIVRDKSCFRFFSDTTDTMLPLLKTFKARRAIFVVMDWVRNHPGLIHATANRTEGYEGDKVLNSLGFTHYEDDVYIWLG